jgi:alpha-beta hydrolase superfamily lysophospholipase
MFFKDPLHDDFGTWPLAYIPYGGADVGEIEAIARLVGDGDDAAYHDAWTQAAGRLTDEATAALAKGHRASARDLFLRASAFHAASYHPFFGAPVDPRLLTAFRRQREVFDRGLALGDPPVEPRRIPFGDTPLPAYLLPAAGLAREVRPLLILTNGYDATITDLYFASAVAASRRGYHCLMFDGPGQGAMLYEHGVPLRPDWETVIAAVVDFALAQPIVDPARIALGGWSLGGHLAPRGASGNPHIAALIADPGVGSLVTDAYRTLAVKLGASREAAADLGTLEQAVLDRLQAVVMADRRLRWNIEQRGFWVHGVDTLRDYLRSVELFTLEGRIEQIRCPTLLTMAEDDDLAAGAPVLFDALKCPKTLMRFSGREGAGEHCEMRNRSRLNRRALDWLDEQFSQ